MHTVVQALGVAVALTGFYLLAGPAWTALVGGLAVVALSVFLEFTARPRPAGPEPDESDGELELASLVDREGGA